MHPTPRKQPLELLNAALQFEQSELGERRVAKLNDVIKRVNYSSTAIYSWSSLRHKPTFEAYLHFAKCYGWDDYFALDLAKMDGAFVR